MFCSFRTLPLTRSFVVPVFLTINERCASGSIIYLPVCLIVNSHFCHVCAFAYYTRGCGAPSSHSRGIFSNLFITLFIPHRICRCAPIVLYLEGISLFSFFFPTTILFIPGFYLTLLLFHIIVVLILFIYAYTEPLTLRNEKKIYFEGKKYEKQLSRI